MNNETNTQETQNIPLNNNKIKLRKKLIITFLLLLILSFIVYYIYNVIFSSNKEETDNAYVQGNIIHLSSNNSGIVIAINTDNTKFVKKGDVLVELDPTDSIIAFNKAQADLASTVRKVKEQYVNVNQYKDLIYQKKVNLEKAKKDYYRRLPLAKKHIISQEELTNAKFALLNAKASLRITKEQAETAKSSISGVNLVNNPQILQAKEAFIQAWVNNRRNKIVAPISGYVAQRSVQVGNKIAAGTSLLSIIPLNNLWVEANFKESQIKYIRIGQPVTIITDLYGSDVKYHGKVIGLSAGTGSVFALLPAQNATGNWIKIVQRIPVKISLDNNELQQHPLRIGLSTNVTIDTSNQSGAILSKDPIKTIYSTNTSQEPIKEAEFLANQIINKNAGIIIHKHKKNNKKIIHKK